MAGCWPGFAIRYRGIKSELSIPMTDQDFNASTVKKLLDSIPKTISYDKLSTTLVADQDLSNIDVSSPNFIIINFDILEGQEFDHTQQSVSNGAKNILDLVEQNPKTKFVLFYMSQNAESVLKHPRLDLVRFGSGLTCGKQSFQNLKPVTEKNLASKKNFISLNRSPRQHRINLVSYLLGLDLESHGTISFGDSLIENTWLERVSWTLSADQEQSIKPVLLKGYEKSKQENLQNFICLRNLVKKYDENDCVNFDQNLRSLYLDHFVEIICETQFNRAWFGLSEKFLFSVYASNFPILVAGAGAVNFLRNFGFDMFDDIVDHSYDNILDPLDRLCAAVDRNKMLLIDNEKTKKLWHTHRSRFAKNIEFAKTTMYEKITQQAFDDFAKVKWNT